MLFSRLKAYVSASPLAHVVIAAFIGAVLPYVVPLVQNGSVPSPELVKVALSAGIAAVLRAVILAVPSKAPSA